jgi:2-C-methyl-D-erythritol 4-phosphate cytidylyltransferase
MTDYRQKSAAAARLWALIPCAGTGARCGSTVPKQYQVLAGRPMVLHTLAAFAGVTRVVGTLVVVAGGDQFFTANNVNCLVAACGGASRAASVFNGLKVLTESGAVGNDWVLVHDAARCLVTTAQINALIDACAADEVGGLLAHKLPDTLKVEVAGRATSTLERSDKWLAQTPQMFRIGVLMDALAQAGDKVTDEASAIEAIGLRPLLVPGSAQNFKLTYPDDFMLAEALLNARLNGLSDPPSSVPGSSQS